MPGPPDASNVQLLGHGTGFAGGLESPGKAGLTVLVLSRTTGNWRSWRQSRTTLSGAADTPPLLGFSDADHGWLVFGGVTWRTSDGGTGWTRG